MGKILLLMSFIIQGPAVLIIVIVTNVLAMVSYKRYLKRNNEVHKNSFKKREDETKAHAKKTKKEEILNKKLLFMTFYFSVFSVIYHIIQFSAQFVITIFKDVSSNWISAWFVWINMFIIAFKNISNIFFYYHYSIKFRNSLLFFRKRPVNRNKRNKVQTL
jgi:hypothetical protein